MSKLLTTFPLPWQVLAEVDETWKITASNDEEVVASGSYTGDGDHVYLTVEQARELCDLVNKTEVKATESSREAGPL